MITAQEATARTEARQQEIEDKRKAEKARDIQNQIEKARENPDFVALEARAEAAIEAGIQKGLPRGHIYEVVPPEHLEALGLALRERDFGCYNCAYTEDGNTKVEGFTIYWA